ncbi:MAG: family 16 glycoside hydrolase, partial [Ferruginibacter sp.]
MTLPATAKSASLVSGDTASFKILSYKGRRLELAFTPSINFIGITKATVKAKNSSGKSIAEIKLTGLSSKGLEGENEVPLSIIVDALGYKTNIGWTSLANHSRPQLQGDELSPSLFKKAGTGNVEIIPVARYSPDFELPFGYYINKASSPEKHQVGILSKAGKYPEHQVLFPAIASGSNAFDPGNNAFGFYATGPTHTAYSEDVWNMLLFPANAVRATRIYPLNDANGKLLNNTYLLCFEEAKNGDYNDYVFVVKNIVPVMKDPFTSLFNGKSLDGWHSFLRGIGTNKDPGNNFRIEDGALHVIGKDLGYAITEKGYNNFHFKV